MKELAGAKGFGIYVMTYPGDFHLSTMLVRSIQAVSPDIPVMIIPGEGFDLDNHPFDVPVMTPPATGFWAEIGHQDRDFWAFQGPFETFLYLDADTIVVRSLDALARRASAQQGDFIFVHTWLDEQRWRQAVRDPEHPDHHTYRCYVLRDIGGEHLPGFDPEHDFFAHTPFNSGVFAASRSALGEAELAALNRAERRFYRETLGITDWSWRSSELFFRDQGRLNYLVRKHAVPVFPLEPELVCVSGASRVYASVEDVRLERCDFHVIHWMGAKSPTPSWFCSGPLFTLYASLWAFVGRRSGRYVMPGYERLPECTGYSVWRHHYLRSRGRFSLGQRLKWSWRDFKRVWKLGIRWLRLLAQSPGPTGRSSR